MTQTMAPARRRTGWSEDETRLLWEAADEAQQQGLPLKGVFDRVAGETGRRPNSIRNYYYAQVQKSADGKNRAARFVPFTEEEVMSLLERVLRERAGGSSVRACLKRMANGDHSLMLRYQNKYRSVVKSRPDLAERVVKKLRTEGIEAGVPEVKSRAQESFASAGERLNEAAVKTGEGELIRACETLSRYIGESLRASASPRGALSVRLDLYRMALDEKQARLSQLREAADRLILPIKEFLGLDEAERAAQLSILCREMALRVGALEQSIQDAGHAEA